VKKTLNDKKKGWLGESLVGYEKKENFVKSLREFCEKFERIL
jgi:hypothetical protein